MQICVILWKEKLNREVIERSRVALKSKTMWFAGISP
jgi:hypothetical protein